MFKTTKNKSAGHFAQAPQKEKRGLATYQKVILATLATLLIIWAAGFTLFSFVFMPKTTLNGHDISLHKTSDVIDDTNDKIHAYALSLEGPHLKSVIKSEEAGLQCNTNEFTKEIISTTKPYFWPYYIWIHKDIQKNLGCTVDTDKLSSRLEEILTESDTDHTEPVDAKINFSEDQGEYVVVKQTPGSAYNLGKCLPAVVHAMEELDPSLKFSEDDLVQPKVFADNENLIQGAQKANELIDVTIDLKAHGKVVATISKPEVSHWISFDDEGVPSISAQLISSWVSDDLSQSLNTVDTKRTYIRPDDEVRCTVSGGSYGWKLNCDKTAEAVQKAILEDRSTSIDLSYRQTAAAWEGLGKKDWGNTWIDIDLHEQYARLFVNDERVWESDIVSGNPTQGNGTPEGVYKINSLRRDIKLIGKTNPETKKPEYESPVQRWMPFIDDMVGLHDASWRNTFGGSIYTWGGSHGCVNLPTDKALELYDLITVGTPVVVHE